MNAVTVVDARMGRGKTSAAIRYINQNRDRRRFLFVTPYLTEVQRIVHNCSFESPDEDLRSKSADLKMKMRMKRNIAATHALFYLMDEEALELARENGYSIIIDESINVIEKVHVSDKDFEIIVNTLATEDDMGRLTWIYPEYKGRFEDYKKKADSGSLFRLNNALLNITNPDIFEAFDEVIMLTYLFDGQIQKAYLDYFGVPYRIVGVEHDGDGFYFSDKPDCPPPLDIRGLIHIVDKDKMNSPFRDKCSLSKTWYSRRTSTDKEILLLRRYLNTTFSSITKVDAAHRIWTCFKDDVDKVTGPKGKYATSYLPMNIRATNEYREATTVAYLVNRFMDPNLINFFAARGVQIDNDTFALSEMIQFIWRSAIRDNKPITLYVPSERMRNLLIGWMNEISKTGE